MADPLKQICDELGVCTEEALFYLEGFRWDLNAAMEACRSKTLPSPAQPPSSENERAAAEENRINDLITRVVEATGATAEDAKFYLGRNNWNFESACSSFRLDHPDKSSSNTPPPPPSPPDDLSEPWYNRGFSGNERSGLMQEVLSNVPQFYDAPKDLRIGSPPSASTAPLELTQESIKQLSDIVPKASSKAVLDCLNHCNGDVGDAFLHFSEVYSKKFPRESLSDETQEELIASFSTMTGETRQVATFCLDESKWDPDGAVSFFFDNIDKISALMENKDPPLPSMGPLPSQSQFESSHDSSGPTETQRPLEEAGDGDITVAIPGVASSQVDDGKAAEEGSSTETVPDPFANRDRTTVETQTAAPSTIVMTIILADGTSLELPFRSDQTVGDIHNAIDQRYPDIRRGYVLRSGDEVDYMDSNITVDRVSAGDSTFLVQIYP